MAPSVLVAPDLASPSVLLLLSFVGLVVETWWPTFLKQLNCCLPHVQTVLLELDSARPMSVLGLLEWLCPLKRFEVECLFLGRRQLLEVF